VLTHVHDFVCSCQEHASPGQHHEHRPWLRYARPSSSFELVSIFRVRDIAAPFNESNGGLYLGILDTLFLAAYAAGLFISGSIGDRVNLRWFMGLGMIGAGGAVVLFGFAEAWGIHAFGYFAFCNLLAGVFQSTGWPSNVTVMSRWWVVLRLCRSSV
jgi:MFS family permease